MPVPAPLLKILDAIKAEVEQHQHNENLFMDATELVRLSQLLDASLKKMFELHLSIVEQIHEIVDPDEIGEE
jgi:hypothetical protein